MKHFTLSELCRSDTARKHNINNKCSLEHIQNLIYLIDNILDPLREAWGKPIRVNSGYRSAKLNKLLKGVRNSQHLKGQAADITTGNKADNKKLFELIQELNLPFDQLIDEKGYQWIHISYKKENGNHNSLKT